jgi:hypothetical protein
MGGVAESERPAAVVTLRRAEIVDGEQLPVMDGRRRLASAELACAWPAGAAGRRQSQPAGNRRGPGPRPESGGRARRSEDEKRHRGRHEGPGQQRHRRMQPDDRRPGFRGGPQPVSAQRERERRQRQRRPETAAGLLAQPPEHRPALPGGKPGNQVHGDSARPPPRDTVQAGDVMLSSRKISVANANHGVSPVRACKPRTHAESTRNTEPRPLTALRRQPRTTATVRMSRVRPAGPPEAVSAAPTITQRNAMFTLNS